MESQYTTSERRIRHVSLSFHRYLYAKIDWDDRLIAIQGARGTGTTTMMLQRIKECYGVSRQAVYVSLDNLFFTTHSLAEFVEYHYMRGGRAIFIDEVHRYPKWQTAIKNIYDDYPDLKIVYSGSSMLQIDRNQGDLSRRQIVYELEGLSFREYLEYEGLATVAPVALTDLLKNHSEISWELTQSGLSVIPRFHDYLKKGYYPFYKEVKNGYGMRLEELSRQVIESDMPAVEDVRYSTIEKTKKMLMVLADNAPQTPNIAELCRQLDTTRDQGLKMLGALERGGLIQTLMYEPRNFKVLAKPDKILMDNPNLMYALATVGDADTGSVRESFFCSQLRVVGDIRLDRSGDFAVDNRFIFEVGGKNKTFDQIANLPDSYLANDNAETASGNRVPLYLFGLLY